MIFASDFSFAERAIIELWVWIWFIHRVWSTDKFASLQLKKICNFDLKSIITLLILLMLPAQAIFDVTWTYLKYSEGFINLGNNTIITKPAFYIDSNNQKVPLWSKEHILLKSVTEYLLACGFAFQIGTLTLMQAFWSHLSSQMGGKPFMRSWKSKFYFGLVLVSMIVFPMARAFSSNNIVLVENVPLLLFSIKLLVIFFLGIKNGRRLKNLLRQIQQSSPRGHQTMHRIRYFIEMNRILTFGALLIVFGFSSVSIDAICNINYINSSKFLMDLSLIHANFGSLMLWCTMILIIYPQYYIVGADYHSEPPELRSDKPKPSSNSYVIDLTTTTTATTVPTSRQIPRESSSYAIISKSVSNLLEEQQHQIDTYRHKTSNSISSTTTLTSSVPNTPNSIIVPAPIYESPSSISRINTSK